MIEKPIASNSSILSFVISFCLRLMQVHMSIPRGKMWSETDLVGSRNNSPQNSGQHELRDTANLRFLNANSPIDKTCRTIDLAVDNSRCTYSALGIRSWMFGFVLCSFVDISVSPVFTLKVFSRLHSLSYTLSCFAERLHAPRQSAGEPA